MNNQNIIKAPVAQNGELVSKLALAGDVSGLNQNEKIAYYISLCERVGLDPATQPFKLLRLSGKEVFYCDRGGCAQLSRKHSVSHKILSREVVGESYIVTAQAYTGERTEESIGAVPIANLKGEALCNAYMKAETKSKRRATLDLLGLGMLDESEVGSIAGAVPVEVPAEVTTSAPAPASAPPARQIEAPAPSEEAWRAFVIPFGRAAGQTLAKAQKNLVYGFWANFEAKNPKDREFRAMLDEAGKHYGFAKPEAVPVEDQVPF